MNKQKSFCSRSTMECFWFMTAKTSQDASYTLSVRFVQKETLSNIAVFSICIFINGVTVPVADLGGVMGVQMHAPLAASNVFLYITARVHRMIMQQWNASATTRHSTHSRISSLLISRHLTRPRDASRYSVRTSSYFKQLTS